MLNHKLKRKWQGTLVLKQNYRKEIWPYWDFTETYWKDKKIFSTCAGERFFPHLLAQKQKYYFLMISWAMKCDNLHNDFQLQIFLKLFNFTKQRTRWLFLYECYENLKINVSLCLVLVETNNKSLNKKPFQITHNSSAWTSLFLELSTFEPSSPLILPLLTVNIAVLDTGTTLFFSGEQI